MSPIEPAPATRGGARRSFAVVGSPIGHSLSPVLHRAAYRALGVTDARYTAHEVTAGELEAFLADPLGRGMDGLSVTMPLKHEARRIAAERDEVTERLGIANTLVRLPDGGWRAENHDVHGIRESLRRLGADQPASGAVIGSGATALSALAALIDLGVQEIALTARDRSKLATLEEFAARFGIVRVRTRVVPWEKAGSALDVDVAVSALAAPGDRDLARRLARGPDGAPVPTAFLDVLYDPWPVPLAALMQGRGAAVISGVEMLVQQAGRQVESMLSVSAAPLDAMRRAAQQELTERS